MRKSLPIAAVVLICLTFFLPAAPAGAYVLESGHILQLAAGSFGKARYLKIDQQVVIFDPFLAGGRVVLPETLRYGFPLRFRSDIQSKTLERIHVASRSKALTITDGRVTSENGGLFDSYKDLLLPRSRALFEQTLGAAGVDTEVTSLGRFNDTLALVIGAQYPDESVPQVWVDKAAFRPLRWIVKTKTPLVRDFEIRYLHWQETGGSWYPWQIEFYENQMLVRRIVVGRVEPQTKMAGELFDFMALKKQYKAVPDAPGAAAEQRVDEVQDTIETFKKQFK